MTTDADAQARTGRRLLQLGVLLFLIGLLIGFAVPVLVNPRMGLAAHLEGVLNGLFLGMLGLLWPKLVMSARLLSATFWLAAYGTFANVLATLLGAAWGTGHLTPIGAQGHTGTDLQEGIVKALLVSLALVMVAVCVLVLIGLRGGGEDRRA